ncbi:MAG: hypothetical protein KDD11_00300 [Acidobacteria bacterium]|nr:hypothetical protein [Acidobacteriota bacterium]
MPERSVRRNLALLLWVVLPFTGSVGCATTAKVSGFDVMAVAGARYAQAVDELLVTSGRVLVDTNSDKLLRTETDFPGSVTAEALAEQDDPLRENLAELALLRRQAGRLSDYFTALDALATTGAVSSFGGQIGAAVADLQALSTTLGTGQLARNPAAAGELAGSVGSLAVRHVQLRELERELEARKETIAEVLHLHQALFEALEAQIAADVAITRQQQYQDEVVGPLVNGAIEDPVAWKARRQELLAPAAIHQQLAAAASAAETLRTVWARLLAGGLTPADVEAVVAQLSILVDQIGALRESPATPGGG